MIETLAEKTCTPCRGGIPPLGRDEALRFQAQAPDWELRDDARRIERTFRFPNFREALAFVQQVGGAKPRGVHCYRRICGTWLRAVRFALRSCNSVALASAALR